MSFDLGHRIEEFESFEDEKQFSAAADRLALRAVDELKLIDSRLTSPGAVAQIMPKSSGLSLWPRYHRAVSHALLGETGDARKLFQSLLARVPAADWEREFLEQCARMAHLVSDLPAFREAIAKLIRDHRVKVGLPPAAALSV